MLNRHVTPLSNSFSDTEPRRHGVSCPDSSLQFFCTDSVVTEPSEVGNPYLTWLTTVDRVGPCWKPSCSLWSRDIAVGFFLLPSLEWFGSWTDWEQDGFRPRTRGLNPACSLEQFLFPAAAACDPKSLSVGFCWRVTPVQWSCSCSIEVDHLSWEVGWRLTVSIHPARAPFPTPPHRPHGAYSRSFPHRISAVQQLYHPDPLPYVELILAEHVFQRWRFLFLFSCFPHHRYTAPHNVLSICDTLDLVQWVSCPYCCWSLQFAAEKAWWVFHCLEDKSAVTFLRIIFHFVAQQF